MGIRVNVEARVDSLNKAIDRLAKVTTKDLAFIVTEAAVSFSRGAGKRMEPQGFGIPMRKRKRNMYTGSAWRLFNLEGVEPDTVIGNRPRTRNGAVYGVQGKKRRDVKYYWNKAEAQAARIIKYRGVAKAQFWAAAERIKIGGKPGRIWTTQDAATKAASMTSVTKGRDLWTPFVAIRSAISTGSGLQPFAQVAGLGVAQRQMTGWLRRLEGKQKAAWQ